MFIGLEVPPGKSGAVPEEEFQGCKYVHITQVALGADAKDNDRTVVEVSTGEQKVVIGTLHKGRCDQIQLDLLFDEAFKFTHNGKSSVFVCGYEEYEEEEGVDNVEVVGKRPGAAATARIVANGSAKKALAKPASVDMDADDEGEGEDDDDEDDEEEEEEELRGMTFEGMPEMAAGMSSGSEDDFPSGDDEVMMRSWVESIAAAAPAAASRTEDDEDNDEDDEEGEEQEEEVPAAAAKLPTNKRPAPAVTATPQSGKKAKQAVLAFKSPGQTASKAGASAAAKLTPAAASKPAAAAAAAVATPKSTPGTVSKPAAAAATPKTTPGAGPKASAASTPAAKTPSTTKTATPAAKTPESGVKGGSYVCTHCTNKTFTTESALSQHTKAKHS
eukprot:jgi/Mesen1/10918/ME000095S10254